MRRGALTTLIVAVYLAVGVIVANSHHYFRILWPLVLLKVNLHIK